MSDEPRPVGLPTERGASRIFGDARSRSVWRWQIMLALSVVVIAGVSALLTPKVFTQVGFLLSLSSIVILTLVALTVPWERSSSYAILAVPTLDIVAIYFLDSSSEAPMSFLWVIPIAWIATYSSPQVLIASLGLTSGLMLMRFAFEGLTAAEAINLIMQLITLGFIGISIAAGANRNRASRRLLQAQTKRTESALHRVSDQKSRTQRMLDSLDIGIARVGNEGILQLANRRFQELYSFEEAGDFSLARAVEYRSRRGTPTPWNETTISRASRRELFADETVWLFGIDGKWRALLASTLVMAEGDIAKDGLLLTVKEITEKVDPQASHGAAMRTISHELRNPLTAILGHVDLLLENDDLNDKARTQAEIIQRAGDRMETLIDHALSVDGPAHEDEDVEFDLATTVQRSIEAFAPTANTAKIRLDQSLNEPLPMVGDMFRIRQVIDNVLSNAIKYTQRGGVISVHGYYRSDHCVAVEVADTGVGISAEDLPHIFDAEYRATSARDSSVPGTGLGLSISKDITSACGGELSVYSELGSGTTVTIMLPTEAKRPLR